MKRMVWNLYAVVVGLGLLTFTFGASASAQERDSQTVASRTLVLTTVDRTGTALVRVLRLSEKADRLRQEGRVKMPIYGQAREMGDVGSCFIVSPKTAQALSDEVTCGIGGVGVDTQFDPIARIEEELEPPEPPDTGGLRSDESDDNQVRSEDYGGGKTADVIEYGGRLGLDNDGKPVFGGWVTGSGGDTTEVDWSFLDYKPSISEEQVEAMKEMDDGTEEDSGFMGIDPEVLAGFSESESEEEDDELTAGDVIDALVGAVGDFLDYSEEQASEDEEGSDEGSESDQDDAKSGDQTETRPDPEDTGVDPAECEDELAERFDVGRIDPIDPHPDDTADAGGYSACFGDATVVTELVGCAEDLVARPGQDGGSLCVGKEFDAEIPMLTKNDLVIDDMSPGLMTMAIATTLEFAGRLRLLRTVEPSRQP